METSFLFSFSLLLILNNFFPLKSSATPLDLTTDQDALLAFKKGITLDTNGVLSNNWLTNTSVCYWTGVSCGIKHHRVTALNLSGFALGGNLAPHIGNLTFLQSFDVSSNSFTGAIPSELTKLRRLKKINVKSNNLSGDMPRGIFTNMSVLEEIDLRSNKLSGRLPNNTCHNTPKIRRIYLKENQFYGKIPTSIYRCTELEVLSLSENQFSGDIPTEIGKLSMLTLLSMYDNDLKGN